MQRKKLMKRLWPWLAASVLLPVFVIGGYLGYLQLSGNFHVVLEGQLYRSAQPTSIALRDYAKSYGVKTVVNLRGRNDNAVWYEDETGEALLLGIRHVDFKMSASRELTMDEVSRLVTLLRDVPKPILIHCQGGADRSGLVAAIYLHQISGVDVETAEGQISLFYGHISIPYLSSAYAMDRTWEQLEQVYESNRQVAKL